MPRDARVVPGSTETTSLSSETKTSKTRSTCQACADSKIGCSKTRPTCARCERRGTPCVYSATKRAGRPSGSKNRSQASSPASIDTNVISATTAEADMTWKSFFEDLAETPRIFMDTPLAVPGLDVPEQDLYFSPDYTDMLNGLSHQSAFDLDAFSLPPDTEAQHLTNLFTAESEPMDLDHISRLQQNSNDPALLELLTTHEPSLPSSGYVASRSLGSDGRNTENVEGANAALQDSSYSSRVHHGRSMHGCMTRCLCFLQELTPDGVTDADSSIGDGDEGDPPQMTASFESVTTQARTALDAVNEILQCACSHNSVLLFNLALVLFRILEWYDACTDADGEGLEDDSMAGCHTSEKIRKSFIIRKPSRLTLRDYDIETSQHNSVVCQIVLSSLHDVHSTSKLLVQKLSCPEKGESPPGSSPTLSAHARKPSSDSFQHPSITNANLAQSLTSTLQRNLAELGQKCIRRLSEA